MSAARFEMDSLTRVIEKTFSEIFANHYGEIIIPPLDIGEQGARTY